MHRYSLTISSSPVVLQALEMYLQKLELATKVGNTLHIAKAHSALGLLYQVNMVRK